MNPPALILAAVLSQQPAGDVGWKEYVDLRFAEMQRAVDAAMVAQQKAIDKSEALAADNKADANEWRGAFADRERAFMTRAEIYSMAATAAAMIGAAVAFSNWKRMQGRKTD